CRLINTKSWVTIWSSGCFFFQAEDGIRDRNVTGVQTCALPIFDVGDEAPRADVLEGTGELAHARGGGRVPARGGAHHEGGDPQKIGRASCRERVWITGVERK